MISQFKIQIMIFIIKSQFIEIAKPVKLDISGTGM